MNYKNYIQIKKHSLRYNHFCFMDASDYLADGLFIKHKVRVKFGSEFGNNGGYAWIFCKVRKKDTSAFLLALEELKNKMLLCGHTDYQDLCEAVVGMTGES